MIVLGVLLLILGFLFNIAILWEIGVALAVIGVVLYVVGSTGRTVAGRRHFW